MAKMKKDDLGKGIRALLSSADEKDTGSTESLIRELSNTVAMIPTEEIEVNPFQPRTEFDRRALEELAGSIETHGLIQPITVRHLGSGSYQIISGERRVRASRMAGLKEIPAYIRVANDQEMLEMALIENIQRENLNPLEVAFSYQRLIDEIGITHEEVAKRVSKRRATVTNYLRLLKLPPAVQEAVREEEISMGHARALAGVDDLSMQLALLSSIQNHDWSVRRLESKIRENKTPGKEKKKPPAVDPAVNSLQNELSSTLGTKVTLTTSPSGKGKVTIFFEDHDGLQQIIDLVRSAD